MFKKLGSLKFGVMSPDQIRKLSVLEIKSPELYDRDGFPVEGGLMDPHLGVVERGRRCKTCGHTMDMCPGHFGHLELIRPIVHVGFYKKVDLLLNTSCKDCGNLVFSEADYSNLDKVLDIEEKHRILLTKGRGKATCPSCGAKRLKIKLDPPTNFYIENAESETGFVRLYANEIREWLEKIPTDDLKKIGFNVRPEWFVLTVLPVPPVNMHPSITLDNGIKSEDDLTFKLVEIVITNNRLRDNINAGTPQLIIEDLWNLLQYNVTTYFNNNTPSVPPAKHRSGRALKTIVQRIKGKSGIIRNNLMGKRVNYAARTTITPDIYISVDEIGVPESMCDVLTFREKVNDSNIDRIRGVIETPGLVEYVIRPNGTRKKLTDATKEQILTDLAPGFSIERKLMDGDTILFNRQPSLHRSSIMAHKVRRTKGLTFRLNPTACAPYNADYDGDEMNLHVPQSPEGIVEARELLAVDKQIVSPRDGGPIVVVDEDGISGAFLLSLFSTKVPRDIAMNYFGNIGLTSAPEADLEDGYYSGKLLFSLIIPEGITLKYNTGLEKYIPLVDQNSSEYKNVIRDSVLEIKDGKLKSGVVDSKSLAAGVAKLVQDIYDVHGGDRVIKFYNDLNKMSLDILTKFGLTVGLSEYEPSKGMLEYRDKLLDDLFENTKKIEADYKAGKLQKMPGKTLEESFESMMKAQAFAAKNKLEKYIAKERISGLFTDNPDYNSLMMILSGARGKMINLNNIVGIWGQCAVREHRPNRGYTSRVIPTFKRGDNGALARGFVTHGLYEGLSPRELYFHAMGGRQGEVDTGVSTKISGYLYRRISNALRDVLVEPDLSVRTSDNKIIEFVYGEDGIYTQSTYKGDPLYAERLENIARKVLDK